MAPVHSCDPKKLPVLAFAAVAIGVEIRTPTPAHAYSIPILVPYTAKFGQM